MSSDFFLSLDIHHGFLDERIEKLMTRMSSDERLVCEKAMLSDLPHSWAERGCNLPVRLFDRRHVRAMGRDRDVCTNLSASSPEYGYASRTENIVVRTVGTNEPARKDLQSKMLHHPDSRSVLEAAIAHSNLRPIGARGREPLQALVRQVVGFIAWHGAVPLAYWEVALTARLNMSTAPKTRKALIPSLTVDLVKSVTSEASRNGTHAGALVQALGNLAVAVTEEAASQIRDALREEIDTSWGNEDKELAWLDIALRFPAEHNASRNWTNKHFMSQVDGQYKMLEVGEVSVSSLRLVTCSTEEMSPPAKPLPEPVAPVAPGEVFTLAVTELRNIRFGADSRLYSVKKLESVAEFRQQLQRSPEQVIAWAEYKDPEKGIGYERRQELFKEAVHRLGEFLDPEDWDVEHVLRSAIWNRGVPAEKRQQTPLRLAVLADVATKVQYGEVLSSRDGLKGFLERATAGGGKGSLERCPARLKVAKAVAAAHPEITRWAQDRGVSIVNPKSGFDAGIHFSRLWMDGVETALSSSDKKGLNTIDNVQEWARLQCGVLREPRSERDYERYTRSVGTLDAHGLIINDFDPARFNDWASGDSPEDTPQPVPEPNGFRRSQNPAAMAEGACQPTPSSRTW